MLSLDTSLLDSAKYDSIESQVILKTQRQDPIVCRVLAYKLDEQRPNVRELRRELPSTRALLREWHKLEGGRRWVAEEKEWKEFTVGTAKSVPPISP